jgi:hypothetical protein
MPKQCSPTQEPPKDSVTEVKIPVLGVVITIDEVCKICGEEHEFRLSVRDLDSGEEFKAIRSEHLRDLLDRQHQLTLGFAE